ncbi:sodium:proton antiporter [Ferruginibacter sp.]|uniref:cation:proton antiporter n=1 Tax=Ferruginibacter sp. TaxID=1940288 RepID=UPI001992083D|nr:sodium:proton antiporter [Ferruginibacter sp.]MBC7627398.1 sodium:proton antiporter [Ferruginibacter sp.]
MDLLTIITILIIVCTVFSYLNERILKLPGAIGLVTISIMVSILILIIGKTDNGLTNSVKTFAQSIDFSKVLLNIMLGFLMFAGAFHFDYQKLKEQRLPVFLLSTLGVIISTGVFGGLLYLVTLLLHFHLPIVYCLLFGAIVSPTDPIAVAAILKSSKIPPRLNTIIAGESLFNDGIGLILFVIILGIADKSSGTSFGEVIHLFVQEVLGGIIIGLILGYLGYKLIKTIDDFQTIFLISIALVLGISVIAGKFHVSVPLSAVTAGLIVGNNSIDKKNIADQFLSKVWQLVNDLLNTILFVMIGLQMVMMPFLKEHWITGLISIVVLLIARVISVALPAVVLLRRLNLSNLSILTWAGLRGGISIAMALTLPESRYRELILSSCYFVVIFSIIFQGLTLKKVVEIAVRHKAE